MYNLAANNYVYELRDNVGSVRTVVNRNKKNDGSADVVQYDDYYPYGSIARNGGAGYRYEYQGVYAEKDPVTSWNNFELRMYDGRVGRWLSMDPKGQFSSPYEGMGNNPVSGMDPTGGWDWYKDSDGSVEYDPNVKGQSDLKDGQKYLGATYSSNGAGKIDYRIDGSILFHNETDAYKRMWDNANKTDKEEFGAILNNTVLVTPSYGNNVDNSAPWKYGYKLENGNLYDPVANNVVNLVATIHTHQNKSFDPTPSFLNGDVQTFAAKMPNKYFLVMGWDNKLYGGYSYRNQNKDIVWADSNFDKFFSVKSLLQGKTMSGQQQSLRGIVNYNYSTRK